MHTHTFSPARVQGNDPGKSITYCCGVWGTECCVLLSGEAELHTEGDDCLPL